MKTGIKIIAGVGLFFILFQITGFINLRLNGYTRENLRLDNHKLKPFKHLIVKNAGVLLHVQPQIYEKDVGENTLVHDSRMQWNYEYAGDTLVLSYTGITYRIGPISQLYLADPLLSAKAVDCRSLDLLNIMTDSALLEVQNSTVDYRSEKSDQQTLLVEAHNSQIKITDGIWGVNASLIHSELRNSSSIEYLTATLDEGSYIYARAVGNQEIEVIDQDSYYDISSDQSRPVVDRSGNMKEITDSQVIFAELVPGEARRQQGSQMLVFSSADINTWNSYAAGIKFNNKIEYIELTAKNDIRLDVVKIKVRPGQTYHCWFDLNVKDKKVSLYVKDPETGQVQTVYADGAFRAKLNQINQWNLIHNPNSTDAMMEMKGFGFVNEVGEYPEKEAQ